MTTKWYHYLAAFGAGFFLLNAVPHMVSGVTGQLFPSPFADPPGIGMSPPLTNVIWALINILIGYGLLRLGAVRPDNRMLMLSFFVGMAVVAVMLSTHFGSVMGLS